MKTLLLVAFLLGACADLGAWEKDVAEPQVDELYDASLDRLCKLPLDVQIRAINRHGGNYLRGLIAEDREILDRRSL